MSEPELTVSDVFESAERAAIAEVAFLHNGRIVCEALTPLRLGDRACFALTYGRTELVQQLASSSTVTLTFTDSRLAYKGWKPLAAQVRCDVFPDPEGTLFTTKLLNQELHKFPPSRALIDTPLLRREHWWYVPRWIVRIAEVLEVRPLTRRSAPEHGVLFVGGDDAIRAATVEVSNWEADDIEMRMFDDVPDTSTACTLATHDFSVPDLEDRVALSLSGALSGARLHVEQRHGTRTLGRRRDLVTRLRAQAGLKRACMTRLQQQGLA